MQEKACAGNRARQVMCRLVVGVGDKYGAGEAPQVATVGLKRFDARTVSPTLDPAIPRAIPGFPSPSHLSARPSSGPRRFFIPDFSFPAPSRRRASSLGPLSGSSGRAFGSRCRAFGNSCRAFGSRTRRLWSPCRALWNRCRAFPNASRTLRNCCRRLVPSCRTLGNGCRRLDNPCRPPSSPRKTPFSAWSGLFSLVFIAVPHP